MESKQDNWKTTTLIIGAVLGTLAGLGAAYILIQRAQTEESHPRLTAGEGVKLGISVLGLLRQVAEFASIK